MASTLGLDSAMKERKMHGGAEKTILCEFRKIPGIGKTIAQDRWHLGFQSVEDKDPEEMYLRLCDYQRTHVDRCMLYVFRCVVYLASNEEHDPELLKRWNWKDVR